MTFTIVHDPVAISTGDIRVVGHNVYIEGPCERLPVEKLEFLEPGCYSLVLEFDDGAFPVLRQDLVVREPVTPAG